MNTETIEVDSSSTPPRGINPGIRMLVALLNAEGYPTTDSGDGKTHDYPCDREGAYVVIRLPAHRAAHIVDEARAVVGLLGLQRIALGPIGGDRPWVQASYDPADGTALIDVCGIDDAVLMACRCGENEACSRCPKALS